MKNKFMKKAVAATLSAAVALSLLPLQGLTDVLAKASFVKLNTTFKTLTVGQTYKLKLKNNTLGWKVTKSVSKDSAVCKAANRKSYVKLTAKGEGRTTVRVTLKTAKRKGAGAVKKLSCRVNVKPVDVLPDTPEVPDTPDLPDTPEIQTDQTVESQEDLEKALADENIKKITIQTSNAETFKIAEGKYDAVELVVDAAASDVVNYGVFKSITVKAIKDRTWTEKAKGNSMKIEAPKARIIVDEDASVAGISCTYMNAVIRLEIRGNMAGAVSIGAKLNMEISGTSRTQIPVVIEESAKDAELLTKIPLKVTVNTDAEVTFEKGAEKSTMQVANKASTVKVKNNTTMQISVKKADNTSQSISSHGGSSVVSSSSSNSGGNVSTGNSGVSAGGSSGGSTSQGTQSRKLVVNLSKDTYTYGDTLPEPEVLLDGKKVENCIIKYYKDGETNEISNMAKLLPAGKYKVTASYSNNRYKGEKTFTVEPKSVSPILTGYVVKEFDGNTSVPQENNLSIQLNGMIDSEDLFAFAEYTYASADGGSKKTVNAANIMLGGEGKDNYTLAATEIKADVGMIDKIPVKAKMKVNVATFATGSAVRVLEIDPCDKTDESYFAVPDWGCSIIISDQQVAAGQNGTAAELQNLSDVAFDIQITTAYTKKIFEGKMIQTLAEGDQNIDVELKEVDMKLSQMELKIKVEGNSVRIIWSLPQGVCGLDYPYREWSGRQLVNGEQILPGLTGTALELESLSDVRFDLEVTSEYTKDRYVGSAILSLKEGEQIVIVDLQ